MRDGFHKDKLLDNRFMTVSPLNHGSFGLVFTAKDMLTGLDVAVKCITKPSAVDNANCPTTFAIDDRSQELSIHSKLPEHPNIVNLVHHFETEHHQYMVLELCSNAHLHVCGAGRIDVIRRAFGMEGHEIKRRSCLSRGVVCPIQAMLDEIAKEVACRPTSNLCSTDPGGWKGSADAVDGIVVQLVESLDSAIPIWDVWLIPHLEYSNQLPVGTFSSGDIVPPSTTIQPHLCHNVQHNVSPIDI